MELPVAFQMGRNRVLGLLNVKGTEQSCAASGLLQFACLLKAHVYKPCSGAAAGGAQAVTGRGLGGGCCHG